jgi:hypothetical protein
LRTRLEVAIAAAWRRAPHPDMTPARAAALVMLMLDGLAVRAAREALAGTADMKPLMEDFRGALQRLFAAPSRKRTPSETRR